MDLGIEGLENLEFVGRGRHGAVYRAVQPDLGRVVAVKLVELDDEESRRRFVTEQQASGRLSDLEGVVTVFGTGIASDGRGYLVSDWMPGGSLKDRPGRRRWEEVAAAGLAIARTLVAAHDRGVVHGDLKPGNVLLDASGAHRLADFGLSRLVEGGVQSAGTPGYAAPELAVDEQATAAADVYAWAALMVALLTGAPPPASGAHGRLAAPDNLVRLIDAALSPDPAMRPDAIEVSARLDELLGVETVRAVSAPSSRSRVAARRVVWAGVALAAVGLGGVFLVWSAPSRSPKISQTTAVTAAVTTSMPSQTTAPVATATTSGVAAPFEVSANSSNGYEVRSIDLGGGEPWAPVVGEDRVYVASEDRLLAFSHDDGSILINRTLSGPSTAPPLLFDGVVYVPVMRADCEEKCAALDTFDTATGRLATFHLNRLGVPYTPEAVPASPWCRAADILTNYNREPRQPPAQQCVDLGPDAPILKMRIDGTTHLLTASPNPTQLIGASATVFFDGSINSDSVLVTGKDLIHCIPLSELRSSEPRRLKIPTSCLRDAVVELPVEHVVSDVDLRGLLQVGTMRLTDTPAGVDDRQFMLRLFDGSFADWYSDTHGQLSVIGLLRDVGPVESVGRRFAVAPDGSIWVLTAARVAHRFDLANIEEPFELSLQIGPCPTGADRGFTECTYADSGGAMAIDGAIIYVPNGGDDAVYRLNTATFEVEGSTAVGGDPGTSVVWDAGVWAADVEHARLVEVGVEPSGGGPIELKCGTSMCSEWPLAQEWDRRPVVGSTGLWIPWQGYLIRVSAQG